MKEIQKSDIMRNKLAIGRQSPLRTYKDLTVGELSFIKLIEYELYISLLSPLPDGAGFYLRKIFYPRLFKKVGSGLIIWRNVVIRHTNKIEIGDNVTIDDNCLIDARGVGSNGLVIEDNVIINRNCMIQAKSGPVRIGTHTSLGSNSVIVSMDGVNIEERVLTAGGCYISAGAYHFDDPDAAVMDQGAFAKGAIHIGANSWLGTGVIVLDGVQIGKGAIIGAGAVVAKNVPDQAIAAGVPAKTLRFRK